MTRAEINRLSRKFRIQKQNKGENTPGFVFANSIAEACDQRVIELETGASRRRRHERPRHKEGLA